MSELLRQVLVDKSARSKTGAKQVAQAIPGGEAWD